MASDIERERKPKQPHPFHGSEKDSERPRRNDHRDRHRRPERESRNSREYLDRKRSRSKSPASRHRRYQSRNEDRERSRRPYRHDGADDSMDRRAQESRHSEKNKMPGRRRENRQDRNEENHNNDNLRRSLRVEGPLPSQADSFAVSKGEESEKPKEKPNYGNTGVLAAASNSVAQADGTSIALKYHEPSEARGPSKEQWKLFIFKGSDIVDTVELNLRRFWLIGKDAKVVDLLAEHPSISKQHAVVQFRYTERRNEYGEKIGKIKPYLIDLESENGTSLNDEMVPESRYLELRNKDMIRFGQSTREYVVILAPQD